MLARRLRLKGLEVRLDIGVLAFDFNLFAIIAMRLTSGL